MSNLPEDYAGQQFRRRAASRIEMTAKRRGSTDVVDKATRSRMMSNIRGKNTKPEIAVRRYLHLRGLRFRIHDRKLPGHPDIVLPKFNAAVFVHGCFWHRHGGCRLAYVPKARKQFWLTKLEGNAFRDRENERALRRAGWRTFTVWECDLRSDRSDKVLEKLYSKIAG